MPLTTAETKTIYAFCSSSSLAGGSQTLIDPVGTSTFNTTKVDGDKCKLVHSVHGTTLPAVLGSAPSTTAPTVSDLLLPGQSITMTILTPLN